jgi:hypothetical protein
LGHATQPTASESQRYLHCGAHIRYRHNGAPIGVLSSQFSRLDWHVPPLFS